MSHQPIVAGILRGFLPLNLLMLLEVAPRHGLELATLIGEATGGLWKPSAGTLYPTLKRMEEDGRIAGEWQRSKGAPRRVYSLTAEGRASRDSIRLSLIDELELARQLIEGHLEALKSGDMDIQAHKGEEHDPALVDAIHRASQGGEDQRLPDTDPHADPRTDPHADPHADPHTQA